MRASPQRRSFASATGTHRRRAASIQGLRVRGSVPGAGPSRPRPAASAPRLPTHAPVGCRSAPLGRPPPRSGFRRARHLARSRLRRCFGRPLARLPTGAAGPCPNGLHSRAAGHSPTRSG
ncbi:hypothetical protein PVAP13_1KG252177 [Panicum virgatum]|uniref:Uncharacterized protein n=1 Tax=Panicum virgatum TaxID=38727 RepID=A0A8T0XD77_PANVG|nr:hypothetical protein PVAP13_1KG252177 [Panicum virgatum]